MHSEATFNALKSVKDGQTASGVARDGWRYHEPEVGDLEAESLARISSVLAQHTKTPHVGVAAIWEGWGGLTSSAGFAHFTEATWRKRAPWGSAVLSPSSPSMLWPDEHAWFLATDIDLDSTFIAGSTELIQQLSKMDGLEVLPVDADTYRPPWEEYREDEA